MGRCRHNFTLTHYFDGSQESYLSLPHGGQPAAPAQGRGRLSLPPWIPLQAKAGLAGRRRRAALPFGPVVRCCANQAGFRRIQVLIARISSTIVVLSGSTRLACQRCSHDTRSSSVAR